MTAGETSLQRAWPSPLVNLTYVSDCLISTDALETALAVLVDSASAANRVAGLTGALLLAGDRFVQTLEGDRAAVDLLMQRILIDPRHAVLRIVDVHEVPRRNFDTWLAVYSGSSLFVRRAVSRALLRDSAPRDVDRLLGLMRAFSAPLPPRRH